MTENKYFLGGVAAVVLVAAFLIYATGSYGFTGSTIYDVEDVKTFRIFVDENGFSPNEIVVHKDDKVKFVLVSKDYPHSLVLGDFGVNLKVGEAKDVDSVDFVAWKSGEFYFYDNEKAFLEKHESKQQMLQGDFIVLP